MAKDLCPYCGKNLALVGKAHNCRPRQASQALKPELAQSLAPAEQQVTHKALRRSAKVSRKPKPVKNASHAKTADVKNVKPASPNASTKRTAKWRDDHREESRSYMREYMRKRRKVDGAKE